MFYLPSIWSVYVPASSVHVPASSVHLCLQLTLVIEWYMLEKITRHCLHNFNPKTDFREVPASKNTNALTTLLTRPGFFSQELTQTSAKAPSVGPYSICIDPQLTPGTLHIMPIIGVSDTVSSYRGASAWSHSLHKGGWHLMIQNEATDGKEGRRKRIKAVSSFLLRGCQNRHWQQVAIGNSSELKF